MTTTWADARAVTSVDDMRTALLAKCAARGCTVTGWPDVAPQRAMVEQNATALAYETELRAAIAATASPDTVALAGSDWVDAVVGWFHLDNGAGGKGRIRATKAVWDIPLIVATASAPLTIDTSSIIQLQASDGTIFESTPIATTVINSGSSYLGTSRFTARKIGTSGNVTPGQIVKVISGPAGLLIYGAGTQVLVTAARDDETDDAYIKRALGRWGTFGVGWVSSSFDYLIPLFAPTLTRWRVRDDNPTGPGSVQIILANAAGPATGGEIAAVQAGIAAASKRLLGIGPVSVIAATSQVLTVTGTVYSDGSNGALLANAVAAMNSLASKFPIGGDADGYVRQALLIEILKGGADATYGLTGFRGAKNVHLTRPSDTSIPINNVVSFDTTGLVLG